MSQMGPKISRRSVMAGAAAVTVFAPALRLSAAAPLKIGVLLPLSGALAREGQSCKRGADVSTGVLAQLGLPVELAIADTETNIDTARTRAEKLIADGAQVLVGAFHSAH